MASTGFLAQASLPRLGEISRGSPRICCLNCRLDDEFLFFERGVVSPRREGTRLSETSQSLLPPCSSSRQGETGFA